MGSGSDFVAMAGQNREMLASLDTRVKQIEELLGIPTEMSTPMAIFQCLHDVELVAENVHNVVEGIHKSQEGMPSFVEARIVSCQEEISAFKDIVDSKIEGIINDLRTVKRDLRSDVADGRTASKVKVP